MRTALGYHLAMEPELLTLNRDSTSPTIQKTRIDYHHSHKQLIPQFLTAPVRPYSDLSKDLLRESSQQWDSRSRKVPSPILRRGSKEEEDEEEKASDDGSNFCIGKMERSIRSKFPRKDKVQDIACRGTLVAILRVCAKNKDLHRGSSIHASIVRAGLFDNNVFVGSALVSMYAKCGSLAKAQEVFDELPVRDVVSWSALIGGYAQNGCGKEALNYFKRMQLEGFSPNAITFVCLLKACSSIGAVDKGQEIHDEIASKGLLDDNIIIGNALVDMYAKCGQLAKAQKVFDELPFRNVVSWSALIAGYAQHGHGEEALNCFAQMQLEGLSPNKITYISALKACGSIRAIKKGQELHAEIDRKGLLGENIVLGNALVDMYAKCNMLCKAQEMFDKIKVRDLLLWNTLIGGYAQHGHGEQALNYYEEMLREGICPNGVTYVCVLKACGSIGAAGKGQEIHTEIIREGLMEKDLVVGNALVDMYAKCGLLAIAQEVFDELPIRNLALWNALVTGYGLLGKAEYVFGSLNRMLIEGTQPDLVTFTVVLNVCSHTGLLGEGQIYFKTMTTCYGILPVLEHYTCMLDLFGRAGHFEKVVKLIENMPFSADLLVWHIVLNACRKWGHMSLGRQAYKHAVQLDERDSAAYVCLSNIYAEARMEQTNTLQWTDAKL